MQSGKASGGFNLSMHRLPKAPYRGRNRMMKGWASLTPINISNGAELFFIWETATIANLFRESGAVALYRLRCSTTAKADLWDFNCNDLKHFYERICWKPLDIWSDSFGADVANTPRRNQTEAKLHSKQGVNNRMEINISDLSSIRF